MRTTHIIAQSEKCLQILELIQDAGNRSASNFRDAESFYPGGILELDKYYRQRGRIMQAVADRLTEYYFNQNAKLQQMVLKEQARIAADEIWGNTKAEVEQ